MSIEPEFMQLLRNTFQSELNEHLQLITDGLLVLEKGPTSQQRIELLNGIFRSAHNIKGAARGVDALLVAEIAHRLESLFSSFRQSNVQPQAESIDLCLETIDKIRTAFEADTQGKQPDFDKYELFGRLQQLIESPANQADRFDTGTINLNQDQAPAKPSAKVQLETTVDKEPKLQLTSTVAVTNFDDKPAEVIRVSTDKLHKVSSLSEELQVTKIVLDDHFMAMAGLAQRMLKLKSTLLRVKPYGKENSELNSLLLNSIHTTEILNNEMQRLTNAIRATNNRLGTISNSLYSDIKVLRLVPASTTIRPLARVVRDLGRELGKNIQLQISGDNIEMDRTILEGIRDPLMHLMRNCIDHGIETPEEREAAGKPAEGLVKLAIRSVGGQIHISIEDNGRGIDPEHLAEVALKKNIISQEELDRMDQQAKLELIFRPGFSSKDIITELSGRGVGLDVVKANLRELNGSVKLHSRKHEGTQFILQLPFTLSTERGLQVRTGDEELVIPSTSVDRILEVPVAKVIDVAASHAVLVDERPVPVHDLASILGVNGSDWQTRKSIPLVVVSKGCSTIALLVDEVIGEREIVVKRLQAPLMSVRNISGATLTGSGTIMMVLNVAELVESAHRQRGKTKLTGISPNPQQPSPHILVVDDSITTRTLEKNVLEAQGYQVTLATDGQKAWEILKSRSNLFSLVVTDVEMPNISGFELTNLIKQDPELGELPVIIVTSLANDDDRRKGVEVGADAYIVKGQFETQALLDVVRLLI